MTHKYDPDPPLPAPSDHMDDFDEGGQGHRPDTPRSPHFRRTMTVAGGAVDERGGRERYLGERFGEVGARDEEQGLREGFYDGSTLLVLRRNRMALNRVRRGRLYGRNRDLRANQLSCDFRRLTAEKGERQYLKKSPLRPRGRQSILQTCGRTDDFRRN